MKPDWDSLAKKYADSELVVVGDVDCTSDDGKDVCSKHDVSGYPTLKYFTPGSTDGKKYEGGRSKKELVKFVKKFDPGFVCTAAVIDQCSEKQRAKLQPYLDMEASELQALHDSIKAEMDAAKEARDAVKMKLEAFRKEPFGPQQKEKGRVIMAELAAVEEPFQALKKEKGPTLKLITAARTTEAKPLPVKDEV